MNRAGLMFSELWRKRVTDHPGGRISTLGHFEVVGLGKSLEKRGLA